MKKGKSPLMRIPRSVQLFMKPNSAANPFEQMARDANRDWNVFHTARIRQTKDQYPKLHAQHIAWASWGMGVTQFMQTFREDLLGDSE